MSNKTKKPDFSKAKEGDECWMYGIGETGINSIGDDYVTVWDDENKYVFDKSGYLYFIEEYIGDAYIKGVSCGLEESPMLFNSFAQFQAYWAEHALEMDLANKSHVIAEYRLSKIKQIKAQEEETNGK